MEIFLYLPFLLIFFLLVFELKAQQFIWTKNFDAEAGSHGYGVAVDVAGNVSHLDIFQVKPGVKTNIHNASRFKILNR